VMHDPQKSDPSIGAKKSANNPGPPGAESMEQREGAEGNTHNPPTRRTQCRVSVSSGLERVRQADVRFAVTHPRWEPNARIGPVRICAGGVP
jgi:hypothetical protein